MADADMSSLMHYTWAHLFSDFKAGFIKLESLQDQNAREEKAKSMDRDKEKAWGGKQNLLTQQQWRRPAESNRFVHLSEDDSDDEESVCERMQAVSDDEDMFESKEEEEESDELKLKAVPTEPKPFEFKPTSDASKPVYFKPLPPAPANKLPLLQCVLIGCEELAHSPRTPISTPGWVG